MKKFLTVLVLVLALATTAFCMIGCTKTEYNYKVPAKVIVGYDNAFPPMGFHDSTDNIDKGFDLDLARAVCTKLGVEIELKAIDWSTKETLLNNGTIDLIWNGYTMSTKRMEQVDFSVPYLMNAQVAVVKIASTYQTLADLTGKKLIMQAESTAIDAYRANENLKNCVTLEFGDNVTCATALDTDKGDAIIIDKVVADYLISGNYGAKFRVLSVQLAPEKYAVGIRRKDVGLRIAINDALVDLSRSGDLKRIADVWGLGDALLV